MDARDLTSHRVADLRYRLLLGRVSLEPLRVLRCRTIEAHGWNVRFVILGASHAVVLERGDRSMTELLTCLPPVSGSLPSAEIDLAIPAATETYSLPGDLWLGAGTVTLGTFGLNLGDAFEGSYSSEFVLDLDFPILTAKAPASQIPRTRIGWQLTADGIEIETIHTYPEEAIGARSRSSFALAVDGSRAPVE